MFHQILEFDEHSWGPAAPAGGNIDAVSACGERLVLVRKASNQCRKRILIYKYMQF